VDGDIDGPLLGLVEGDWLGLFEGDWLGIDVGCEISCYKERRIRIKVSVMCIRR